MIRLVTLLLLLTSIGSFSQKRFKVQELIDLYNTKSKEEVIKYIEEKGYVMIQREQSELFGADYANWLSKNGDQILFEFHIPGKSSQQFGIGYDLVNTDKIDLICYKGPLEGVADYKQDLLSLNFKVVKERSSFTQFFERKKTEYCIWYEFIKENESMLSLLSKESEGHKNLPKH